MLQIPYLLNVLLILNYFNFLSKIYIIVTIVAKISIEMIQIDEKWIERNYDVQICEFALFDVQGVASSHDYELELGIS